jgi:hypothetical protein
MRRSAPLLRHALYVIASSANGQRGRGAAHDNSSCKSTPLRLRANVPLSCRH